MKKEKRSMRREPLVYRDMANLFLGKEILRGDGSSDQQMIVERLGGPFDESRYEEALNICRLHVFNFRRYRSRFLDELSELRRVINLISQKSRIDLDSAEAEWKEFDAILTRMPARYKPVFRIPLISKTKKIYLQQMLSRDSSLLGEQDASRVRPDQLKEYPYE